jgi:hypothetical protein
VKVLERHTNKTQEANPFAAPNGGPRKGQERDFFQWARNQRSEMLKSLTEEERQNELEAEKAVQRRMQS